MQYNGKPSEALGRPQAHQQPATAGKGHKQTQSLDRTNVRCTFKICCNAERLGLIRRTNLRFSLSVHTRPFVKRFQSGRQRVSGLCQRDDGSPIKHRWPIAEMH
jgi:hypothetical protein